MGIELPEHFLEKTEVMPESSYGVNKVTLVLKDGRRIQHVFLAWGHTIVKIEGKMIERDEKLSFKTEDITDIISDFS